MAQKPSSRRTGKAPATRRARKLGSPKKSGPGKNARTRRKSSDSAKVVETALAAFAHEVRTPLTGILAISDLLATSGLGERERRWVDTIKAGAEHLSSLATLFVDAARSGRPGAGVRDDLFDLPSLARSIGDSLAGRAAAKGLQCRIEISGKLPALVSGDPVRLRAALENLIDNAVKFTEGGGVGLKVSAGRGRAKGKLRVIFAVSDSGIGLTFAEIKRLFRPFSQANVGIASRFGGAGLGLASVRQVAKAMGGDVTVSPRKGGATFTLEVTLDRAEAQKSATAGAGGRRTRPRGLHILSVEDNPFGRVVLNAVLTELGHRPEFISRGETAVERLAAGGFDAVLMDMVLPGIDGIEAIRRIRSARTPHGHIPIIGISGRSSDEEAAVAAGADGFLVKPVSPRALATALLEASRRRGGGT